MVMLMFHNNIIMFPQSGKQKVYTIGARGGKFCPRIKKMTIDIERQDGYAYVNNRRSYGSI